MRHRRRGVWRSLAFLLTRVPHSASVSQPASRTRPRGATPCRCRFTHTVYMPLVDSRSIYRLFEGSDARRPSRVLPRNAAALGVLHGSGAAVITRSEAMFHSRACGGALEPRSALPLVR